MSVTPPPERSFDPWSVGLLALYPIEFAAVVVIDALGGWAAGLAGAVPVVGSSLRPWVEGITGGIRSWLYGSMAQSLAGYNDLVSWLETLWVAFYGGVADWAGASYAAAHRLAYVLIPQAVEQGIGYAEALANAAETRADGFASGIEAALRALIAGEAAVTAGLVEGARAEALAEVGRIEAEAVVLEGRAESVAKDLFAVARADLTQAVATVEGDLGNMAREVAGELRDLELATQQEIAAVGGAVAGAQQGLVSLESQVAQARKELGAAIPQFEQLLATELDQVLKSSPWAALVAASQAGEAVIRADAETLIILTAAEIRKQMADASVLRAKYGPQVRAALTQLRGKL